MLTALTAAIALSVAAPQPAVDPCYEAYKDRLAEIDQWVQDCISTPIPGPVPCFDWPECCSTEGERMKKEALIELLRCWGWIPPAPEGN